MKFMPIHWQSTNSAVHEVVVVALQSDMLSVVEAFANAKKNRAPDKQYKHFCLHMLFLLYMRWLPTTDYFK